MNHTEDRSFKLDRKAASFRPSDFGLGDVPWLVVALVLLGGLVTGVTYLLDPVFRILPLEWRPVIFGFILGFLVGLRVSAWSSRRSRARPSPPIQMDP